MNRDEAYLDRRTREDLCRRIEELASSYTPEWTFDRKDPDVGSTIAMIYADQMSGNIRRMNQLMDKYHTEFTNLLGLTLKPAYPASGVAVVKVHHGTVPGVALPRQTRLMATGEDGSPVLFETVGDVYLTTSRIRDVLSMSGVYGKIHALLGGPAPAQLLPQPAALPAVSEEEAAELADSPEGSPKPFRLFDYEEPGIQKNALLLYHKTVLNVDPGVPLELALASPEGFSLAGQLSDPEHWRWSYYDGTELVPFDEVRVRKGFLLLTRKGESQPLKLDGQEYHMICAEALDPITEPINICDVRIASRKKPTPPALMLRNGEELDADKCSPFGESVSLFDECYICDQQVFSQQDATVRLSFDLSNHKKLLQLSAAQIDEELKVIKPKPRAVQYHVASTSPQRIVLEYYNGHIWKRLPGWSDWAELMNGEHKGHFDLTFRCPSDWVPVPITGYDGLSLRIRVTQADNCYLLPCEHTTPVLENVTLSYVYEHGWKQPHRLRTVCGTLTEDQTEALMQDRPVTIFKPLPYPEASLYLGFDRPLEGSPISILFDVEENIHFHMEPMVFEYSTRSGFKTMKVVDGTNNFSSAGTILFMPPSDFAPMTVEGISRRWLRIRGSKEAAEGYHAPIRSIQLNAVDIRNCQTQPEETFYVETPTANMTFQLASKNILSAEVFVNETSETSRAQMRQMLEEQPRNVRAEYNYLGEITAFYVRWTEVDTFDSSHPGDRHYIIDRAENTLIFGDGIHVRIPQAQQQAAILVRAVSCDGTRGNVPAGAVNDFYGNVMYVESVSNPVATFAGSDLENLESARKRGANLLSSRGRLISENDFVHAVRAFSDSIEKVKCMAGYTIDGRPDPSMITIAVMTRDYQAGAYSFNNIKNPLRQSLLECCEATVLPESLVLAEPVYIAISVSCWVKADNSTQAFDIQNQILESIENFLNPLPTAGYSGWQIGSLPTEGQLKMLLQSLRFQGHLERIIAVARYADRDGVHETSLDQLPSSPFAIGVNGEHHVYLEFQ